MVRSALGKVAWVGRTASMVFGLALVLALIFGVTSMAFGANGQSFLLGKFNAATALTKLTGNVNGAAMQVVNPNTGINDTALSLAVQPGEAPMAVNSAGKVANLNADTVDGHDAPLWAVVDSTGTLARGNGATSSSKLGTGWYGVVFNKNVSQCAYSATLGGSAAFFSSDGTAQVTNSSNNANMVWVGTFDLSDTVANRSFHLTVNC